jgi:hypothetical protein
MRLMHFTSWADLEVGTSYRTAWETSNYWQVKLRGGWETAPTWLLAGLPPELAELLQIGKYAGEILKEMVFERVRTSEFPNQPSRSRCMFLFDAELDPDEYAKRLGFEQARYSLILVEVDEKVSRLLRTDMGLLNCNNLKYYEQIGRAREYWRGAGLGPGAEVLLEGEFKIVEVLRHRAAASR